MQHQFVLPLTAGGLLVVKLPVVAALEEVSHLGVGPRDGGVDVVGQTLGKRNISYVLWQHISVSHPQLIFTSHFIALLKIPEIRQF